MACCRFTSDERFIASYGAFLPRPPGAPAEEKLKPDPERCVLRVWDMKAGRPLRVLKGHGAVVWRVVCSADDALRLLRNRPGGTSLHRIGEISAEPGLRIRAADGKINRVQPQGFDHLRVPD